MTVPTSNPLATLSCELYGYHPELLPTTVWNFGGDNLTNDSIYTITTKDGSHMIQNGGNTPRPSVRSVLTINRPNTTHMGTYFCSAGGRTSTIHFQVVEGRLQCMILPITSLCYSNSSIIGIDIMQPGIQVHTSSCLLGEHVSPMQWLVYTQC